MIVFVRQKQVFSKLMNNWATSWFEVRYSTGKVKTYRISRPQTVRDFCDKAWNEKRVTVLEFPGNKITLFHS